MLDLLERTFPLMLAAASNPAVVGIVILMLTSEDRPLLRAGAFVAGFGAVLVVVGLVGLWFFKGSRGTFGPGGSLFAWLDIVLGVGMLGFAVLTWVRRDSAASQTRLLERVGPPAFFAVGAIFMITDASALVALGPLLREIAIAPVSSFERGLALALTYVVVILPIALPILIYLLAPRSSQRILAAMRRGLDRYGYVIAIGVFLAIGTYLLVRGITRL
jgi:hypothetical protein